MSSGCERLTAEGTIGCRVGVAPAQFGTALARPFISVTAVDGRCVGGIVFGLDWRYGEQVPEVMIAIRFLIF